MPSIGLILYIVLQFGIKGRAANYKNKPIRTIITCFIKSVAVSNDVTSGTMKQYCGRINFHLYELVDVAAAER